VRQQYLQVMSDANLRVLRIFLLNSCTEYSIDCQGYNTCEDVPDVEVGLFDLISSMNRRLVDGLSSTKNPVGVWNDEILERVDDLMADAAKFNIKLTVALHDVSDLLLLGTSIA